MDINTWCSSSYVKKSYDRINISVNKFVSGSGSKRPRWRVLWRKITREKKRIFDCSSSSCTRVHEPYDPLTYSQNFDDQGFIWEDPDNVSRSFSARFAVPSRVFEKSGGFQPVYHEY
ncbi:uncharacterized protein LOC123218964 [Mangifera indica]|uniref:uncharacterized protein LOC123218964 n=1 Tax=Mangifera indica TaxID=29780 RepID=UPI001CFB4076|nr:uncharacterized protein LOC123218964 [Mangifera indica]